MAGHSQFKNIMHRKGRQDKVKSKLFGKLAREITVSAKLGLPDPAMNPRLRAAMLAARAENSSSCGWAAAVAARSMASMASAGSLVPASNVSWVTVTGYS